MSYAHGLRELGDGLHAYLQPDGRWGYSNAGLIVSEETSLLVDTLFDLRLTRQMLDSMATLTAERPIKTLVNTHANGDHCWGNELVTGAEIVASRACAEEMLEVQPAGLAALMKADGLGAVGDYLKRIFGAFDFEGITVTPPTRTFDGELTLHVGSREVRLYEVGPAHTRGDVIVHLPKERVVWTGDILFIGGTPVVWAGPLSRWIAACDKILSLDAAVVVPGHGPVTDNDGVRAVRDYLSYVNVEAERRFRAGMSVEDAARDIALGAFEGWLDKERIGVNVHTRYRELSEGTLRGNTGELFALMAKLT